MPVSIITDASLANHDPPGHPEQPARLAAALRGARRGAPDAIERSAEPAGRSDLERVHEAAYLDGLERACAVGGWLDADTWAGPASWPAALLAAGCAIEAVRTTLAGEADGAFACVRPPGHHACRDRAMGFCLIDNIAVAARWALAEGLGRVAIVDWDVHHGNGTQEAFWDDEKVLVVSLHQWPHWPLTGREDETGGPAAPGLVRNVCLPVGTGPEAYLARMENEVLPAVEAFRPELVLVSCGFDAHRADPLAGLRLDEATFGRLVAGVGEVAERVSAPAPVLVLEGGYDLDALEASAREALAALGSASVRS